MIVTARQTLAIPDQVMVTKDGKKVVAKTLVVYKIPGRCQSAQRRFLLVTDATPGRILMTSISETRL